MRAIEDFREVQADPADQGKARAFFRKFGDQSLPNLAGGWHLSISDASPRAWLFARPEETVLDQDGGQAPEIVLHAGGDTPSRNALRQGNLAGLVDQTAEGLKGKARAKGLEQGISFQGVALHEAVGRCFGNGGVQQASHAFGLVGEGGNGRGTRTFDPALPENF